MESLSGMLNFRIIATDLQNRANNMRRIGELDRSLPKELDKIRGENKQNVKKFSRFS